MLNIKKIDKNRYLASLEGTTEELGRSITFLIKKELSPLIRLNREITIDMTGVKSINIGGFKMLQELVNKANTRRCGIGFINIEPSVASTMAKLTGKIAANRKKMSVG